MYLLYVILLLVPGAWIIWGAIALSRRDSDPLLPVLLMILALIWILIIL